MPILPILLEVGGTISTDTIWIIKFRKKAKAMSLEKEKEPILSPPIWQESEIIKSQSRLTKKGSYLFLRLTDSANRKQVSQVLETTMFIRS